MKLKIGKWYKKYYAGGLDHPGTSYFSPIRYETTKVFYHDVFVSDEDGAGYTELNTSAHVVNWHIIDEEVEEVKSSKDLRIIISGLFK